MGGQTSRMLRSIAEDSTYIIRQTNHTTYQRSRVAHEEVQSKLEDLRRLKHEMLQSAERDAQRSHVFESFQHSVGKHKQALDEQTEGFVKQFELPESCRKIADLHRRDVQEAREKADKDASYGVLHKTED
ncbi:unnamed protein product [Hyaloperonospora brassicae]|uniref:Tubulin-specific chaperone A n=1 Tax=Hyaloperonospora brassicae TaxID=162125 RepID=A0AAV0V1F0_HYABA|nr:unnamed protein product [Hyaloperonospora brassicae]